jgi:hypothetical protein
VNLSDKIKSINLVEVVQTHVELRPHGNNFTGLCPLHAEKTPSFTIFADNRFKCFGCGAHGDAVDFIQRLQGIDFKDVLKFLGIGQGPLSNEDYRKIKRREQQRQQTKRRIQRERDLAYTLAFLIRSAYKVMDHITSGNLDEFSDTLDSLSWWEYCHDTLCHGSENEKQQCCRELKNMPTIKRNSAFEPGFDLGKWAHRGCCG